MNPPMAKLMFSTLSAMLVRPGTFFSQRFDRIATAQATGILLISSLFFAASGALIDTGGTPMRTGLILLVNALGMVGIGSVLSFLTATIFGVRQSAFSRLWSVFCLCSAAVLLIAWVPGAFMLTEPWKWWLIGIGMVKGLGMTKTGAAITVLFTFGVLVMLVYAIFPVTLAVGGANR